MANRSDWLDVRIEMADDIIEDYLTKIRMGWYREDMHGSMEVVLEEIWRALND